MKNRNTRKDDDNPLIGGGGEKDKRLRMSTVKNKKITKNRNRMKDPPNILLPINTGTIFCGMLQLGTPEHEEYLVKNIQSKIPKFLSKTTNVTYIEQVTNEQPIFISFCNEINTVTGKGTDTIQFSAVTERGPETFKVNINIYEQQSSAGPIISITNFNQMLYQQHHKTLWFDPNDGKLWLVPPDGDCSPVLCNNELHSNVVDEWYFLTSFHKIPIPKSENLNNKPEITLKHSHYKFSETATVSVKNTPVSVISLSKNSFEILTDYIEPGVGLETNSTQLQKQPAQRELVIRRELSEEAKEQSKEVDRSKIERAEKRNILKSGNSTKTRQRGKRDNKGKRGKAKKRDNRGNRRKRGKRARGGGGCGREPNTTTS